MGYEDDTEEIERTVKKPLTKAELEYIGNLMRQEILEEEDAELILTVMRDHAHRAENKLGYILENFPNLTKSVYNFCAHITDTGLVAEIILKQLKSLELQEYQLFWFAHILESFLMKTKYVPQLINELYNHQQATSISKAKVLEIADRRFGLSELREPLLRSGQSDWLSWSAAVGERCLKPASRNHRLAYFSKGSSMNALIAEVVSVL